MANITSPTVIRTLNAAGSIVVPVTRSFKFVGGLVVTMVGPGAAQIDGTGGGGGGAWDIAGNAGGGLVLGTTTDDQYDFIQNNQKRAGFLEGGKYYLKTHAGFDGSGKISFTSAVTTTDDNFTPISVLNFPDQSSGRIIFRAQGRSSDGSSVCAFERSVLFWQNGSGIVVSPKVHFHFTDKTSDSFDVKITSSGNDLIVQVKGLPLQNVNWSANFEYQLIT